MLQKIQEIWFTKVFAYFKKDPVLTGVFILISVFLYRNEDTIAYIKKIRVEDAIYYERQIDLCREQLQKCHNEHVDDVKAFNYTLTKVSDHLDSLKRK